MTSPPFQIEIIGPDGFPVGVIRPAPPPPRRVWLHVLLFAATLAATTLVGGLSFTPAADVTGATNLPELLAHPAVLRNGLGFSLPLMLILLAHETGHYLACRRHRLDATLPYFIPVPFGIGTLGAFIRIRSPLLAKRELLDVGASGPLAGFVAAIPVLLLGIGHSTPVAEIPDHGYMLLGEPLLFRLVKAWLHPSLAHGGDLVLHPTGMAAWFGLFVTAMNLLPFGQLDGGHVLYALIGRWHRRVVWPALLVLVALGFKWPGWWVWAVIALAMRVRHPAIPGEDEPLDPRRLRLAWLCIVVFLLCFTPQPFALAD
ncbi:MAG TPA: site-2 protease family protein [Thermoanaerobaculaceae bacterium]|nr:site-2 protease family protein [Thermoanaerobaculaceae bacterium]HRS15754.1 site-2 protease family protein [Thermoanaerobaculaceae bacterium]